MEWGTLVMAILAIGVWTLIIRRFPDILSKGIVKRIEHS